MYKGEETFGKFVVAGGDSAITLELLKKNILQDVVPFTDLYQKK